MFTLSYNLDNWITNNINLFTNYESVMNDLLLVFLGSKSSDTSGGKFHSRLFKLYPHLMGLDRHGPDKFD